MTLRYFCFDALLQQEDWLSPAYVGIDENGRIAYLSDEAPQPGIAMEAVKGYALPGFQNAHSHAFQYAMAGLAETHPSGTDDDFWTWREAMYRTALSVDPDQAEAIAAMLYSEMLRVGYTHVAEFHYLHHDKDGKPYANLAEMGERMVAAAQTAGIAITLVPVFYQKGGFGVDPQPRQRRFISKTTDEYFKLLETSSVIVKRHAHASLGFSVHSLRAVTSEDTIRTFNNGPKDIPFHIHVAEQLKEVSDCIAHTGQRPMQWLLNNLPVNERFHMVHSTHLDDQELKGVSASGGHVVLCPSTEGNLGDGFFRMKEYCQAGGRWSIGTDSHIGLNPMEEFRMIDYRQRLLTHHRNTFPGNAAQYIVNESVLSGRMAMHMLHRENFALNQPFDALVVSSLSPLFAGSLANVLPSIVYASDPSMYEGTIVNGNWVVRNGTHSRAASIRQQFLSAIHALGNR
ncbi:MAG: formimidoylglutamate deiminase [Bacteroidetes bacterium]|nr:formimidoylglutamate deiminase [Bacteroidota bacterium]